MTAQEGDHSYLCMGKCLDKKRIGGIIKGKHIFVRVDAFHENGITQGGMIHL